MRFLITAAGVGESRAYGVCSHYRAAGTAEQLALGVVLLHAPLAASRTRGQALLARLDTRSSLGLLLVGPEPALLRSLHLRHDFTM